jgi:CheY-like chemotaxis protein/glycine cleavage system H lipoate-binding protein
MQTADILVVDDEQVILDAVKKICTAEGYRVVSAPDARDVTHMLEATDFRMMLCDIMMPQIDGFELLKAARKRAPLMPVVMATGFSTVENAVRSLHEGAIDFVPKPFTSDELLSAVGRAVRLRKFREDAQKGGNDPAFLVVPCPPKYYRLGFSSWVFLEEPGTALVGLSHLFTKIVEHIEEVILFDVNSEIVQGTACGQVRTADGLLHAILAPVSGRIVERNQAILTLPASIEKDPYFEGWLYRLIPSDVEYEVPQLTSCSSGDLY